jgi:hypothetical protein
MNSVPLRNTLPQLLMVGLVLVTSILFCLDAAYSEGFSGIKRHITVYGNSPLLERQSDRERIAKEYHLIITEWWQNHAVKKIKKTNSSIITLFYRDLIGVLKSYDDWVEISKHDDWFMRDRRTGKRILHRTHKWYLMDITNMGYREHLVKYIAHKLSSYPCFDGVFLDDTRTRINLSHFVVEDGHTDESLELPQEPTARYHAGMISFLRELKARLKKMKIIINTDEDGILIEEVDGIMFESFVHGSWQQVDYFPDEVKWQEDLERLQRLVKQDKLILVHSGSRGTGDSLQRQFLFCLTSYLLSASGNSFFYFETPFTKEKLIPFPEYYWRIGAAKEDIPINLVEFKPIVKEPLTALQSWSLHGKQCVNIDRKETLTGRGAMKFYNTVREGCYLSKYFDISNSRHIRISCRAKGRDISNGNLSWMRFGILGKFTSRDKKVIKGGVDLLFDVGSYEWKKYKTFYDVPTGTHYYLVTALGFFPSSQGVGWAEDLQIDSYELKHHVLKREFQNGVVYVNPPKTILRAMSSMSSDYLDKISQTRISLPPNSGIILMKKAD